MDSPGSGATTPGPPAGRARPRTVVGAVIVAGGRVLGGRRRYPPELAGRWEFPGGKVEPGEDVRTALAREVREELGAVIDVGSEITASASPWRISDTLGLRLFLATAHDGPPAAGDSHDLVAWLTPDELDGVDWLDSDRAALPAVKAAVRAAIQPTATGLIAETGRGASPVDA